MGADLRQQGDAVTATDLMVRGRTELYKAALVIGNPVFAARARTECEAAFEAHLDALKALFDAARNAQGGVS